MRLHSCHLLSVLLLTLVAAVPASAQTLRWQTSVGSFDMLLNPTNNDGLQPLVDNMIANVTAGVYHETVVNRAPDGFVLQIGSFMTDSTNVEEIPFFGFDPVDAFDPVVVDANNDGQIDFDRSELTNTRGTVSLALSNSPNSGSSSYFINIGDNAFLDNQGFVPFATIPDMSTVDRIMGLDKVDLSAAVQQSGSLAYTDVPLDAEGDLILIESVAVVSQSNIAFSGPLRDAFGVDDVIASSISDTSDEAGPADPPFLPDEIEELLAGTSSATSESFAAAISGGAVGVPEPSAGLLLLLGGLMRRRR